MTDINKPAQLIVNADDFGLTDAVNQGIEAAHQQGILTSASLMAVGDSFQTAVDIARRNSQLGIGVHLTLVEECPLGSGDQVSTLVDADGRFHRSAKIFGCRYLAGRIDMQQVESELDRQIEKVVASGLPITHLDSHQHVHLLPQVAKVVNKLGEKYSIKRIRSTREQFGFRQVSGSTPFARVAELYSLKLLNHLSRRQRTETAQHFAGFMQGGCLNEQSLQRIVENLQPGSSTELMCHPGLDSEDDNNKAHWGYQWSTELKALTSPEIIRLIGTRNIELVNWGRAER